MRRSCLRGAYGPCAAGTYKPVEPYAEAACSRSCGLVGLVMCGLMCVCEGHIVGATCSPGGPLRRSVGPKLWTERTTICASNVGVWVVVCECI